MQSFVPLPALPLTVPNGGSGAASLTAYAPLFGGTTSTGAVQSGTVGTAGQVLTSNGPGALPTMQSVAGGLTLISASTVTASGAATMDIEWSTTAYDQFLIVFSGVAAATDNVNVNLRMKIGGAYDTGANYLYSFMAIDGGNSGFSGISTAGTPGTSGALNAGIGNAAGKAGDWCLWVRNPQSTSLQKRVDFQGSCIRANGNTTTGIGVIVNSGTAALTGIRLFMSSGNLSGTGRLYGLQNS